MPNVTSPSCATTFLNSGEPFMLLSYYMGRIFPFDMCGSRCSEEIEKTQNIINQNCVQD